MRTLPDPGEGEVFGESRECFEGVVAFLGGRRGEWTGPWRAGVPPRGRGSRAAAQALPGPPGPTGSERGPHRCRGRWRRSAPGGGGGRPRAVPGHGLRRGPRPSPGLPQEGTPQPAPRRCGAEPAVREALPRAPPPGRPRGVAGILRRALEAIERGSGQALGKRQVEDLASSSAVDFDDFYAGRPPPQGRTRRRVGHREFCSVGRELWCPPSGRS